MDVCLTIGLVAIGTFLMRALPFFAGRWLIKERWIRHLGLILPFSIMLLLILQTALQSALTYERGGISEALSLLLTVGLQWKTRNALLSIFLGAGLYMLLRNIVFL